MENYESKTDRGKLILVKEFKRNLEMQGSVKKGNRKSKCVSQTETCEPGNCALEIILEIEKSQDGDLCYEIGNWKLELGHDFGN